MASRSWQVAGAVVACVAFAVFSRFWFADTPAPVVAATPSADARMPLPAIDRERLSSRSGVGAPLADPLLTPELVRIFEQMLGDARAKDKAGLLAEMRASIDVYLPPEWRVRGLALLERYVDYREALSALTAPDPRDPVALRQAFDARAALRARYFAHEEVTGLFGPDEQLDRYMLEKRELEQNTVLSAEQRREALDQAAATWLTPEQRQDRIDAIAHLAVAEQSVAFEARGASPQERFQLREQAYGYEAAQRLAALDQQEQDWQARLARYAAADASTQAQLQQQIFTPEEALRLPGALALQRATQAPKPVR
ncbi:lipase secretion chaperone [Variovorax humicola]|uniref:Lipase helper protein n=1 Tax=Variovorax humicola TaxID=1769758 RepID=A0ABU8WB51_9BURK